MSVIRHIEPEVDFVTVRCVVMPCCGFTFDAEHSDDQVRPLTWTCPNCQAQGAVEDAERLTEALRLARGFLGMAIRSPRSAAWVADEALRLHNERER